MNILLTKDRADGYGAVRVTDLLTGASGTYHECGVMLDRCPVLMRNSPFLGSQQILKRQVVVAPLYHKIAAYPYPALRRISGGNVWAKKATPDDIKAILKDFKARGLAVPFKTAASKKPGRKR